MRSLHRIRDSGDLSPSSGRGSTEGSPGISAEKLVVENTNRRGTASDTIVSGVDRLVRHSLALPLLTREQERELAHKRIAADKEIALIKKTLAECKPRAGSRARTTLEVRLGEAVANRDEVVCTFIERNMRLAIKIAGDFGFLNSSFDSRIASAFEGLRDAGSRFDPEKGAKFSTYASFWVRQRILRDCRVEGPVIKFSAGMIRRLGKLAEFEQRFLSADRKPPSSAEIGAALQLNQRQVRALLLARQSVVVSTEPRQDCFDGDCERDQIADPNARIPGCDLVAEDALEVLRGAMTVLTPRERQIVTARFGIGRDDRGETLETLGRRFGLTRERIRQVEAIALQKLRKRFSRIETPLVHQNRGA